MKLDEAIRQARLAVDAPHPAGYIGDSTFVSRAVLRQVLDELAATSRGVAAVKPAAITLADYVTLRDQFAMHAPTNLTRWKAGGTSIDYELTAADRWRYADAMMERRP